jgi:hypothetical protein
MTQEIDKFKDINYGSRPVGIKVEEVKLSFSLSMFGDYAKAYYNEIERRNIRKLEATGLTVADLETYFKSLFIIRIKSIQDGGFKDWRQARLLFIPAWIQMVISQYGILNKPEHGIRIVPTIEETVNITELLRISGILSTFVDDGMFMVKDGFPRSNDGDQDVMMMAVFDNQVRGIIRSDEPNPLAQLVAAFTSAKIEQDTTFKALYRISYDEIDFIKSMLMNDRRVFQ